MSSLSIPPDSAANPPLTWKDFLARPADYRGLCALALSLWCGFLFFYGLTAGQLWRTENLRALIAEGMLQNGNWVVPTLYGEPLLTKPPGMYLAIVLCSLPVGRVSEWTARLPSALAALATVILFYRLFRRYLGRPAGLLAVLVLPMSLIYLDKTTAAEIDMLNLMWVMGAIVCFLRALEESEKPSEKGTRILFWWLAAEGFVAGGVLTKWAAPAFFYATVVSMLWYRGRLRLLWCWQHLAGVALAAGLCLGWAAATTARVGWDTLSGTILQEALPRLVPFYDREYHQHHSYWLEVLRHPWWLLATGLPWSLAALWSLRPGFARLWDERGRLLLAALHAWTWPSMLFWTLVSDHKPRHSLPLFPGLAGLSVMVLWAWCTGKMPLPWPRIQPRKLLAGAVLAWLAVKLVYIEIIVPYRSAQSAPRDKGLLVASLVPEGKTLFIFRLKDEGIMFYFGRKVVRLPSLEQLPSSPEPLYCILDQAEWLQGKRHLEMEVVRHLRDEQGAPIVLVRVMRNSFHNDERGTMNDER